MYISVGTITVILILVSLSPAARAAIGRWGFFIGGGLIAYLGIEANNWAVAIPGLLAGVGAGIAIDRKEKADAASEAARKRIAEESEEDSRFDD